MFKSLNNYIWGQACFAVTRLISWASVDRGWTGNLAIPSWCYYPLYHRTTVRRLHVTRVLNVPRNRAIKIFNVQLSKWKVIQNNEFWKNDVIKRKLYETIKINTNLFRNFLIKCFDFLLVHLIDHYRTILTIIGGKVVNLLY